MTETLRMKTYFSTSVESALELARRELGAEAMLVNSRQAPVEARHLGKYEVVFATLPEQPAAIDDKPHRSPAAPGEPSLDALMHAGVEPQLARQIIEAQPTSLSDYMASLIAVDPRVAESGNGREIAALIGPPGRGKTTTLVKLAMLHGLAQHKPVRIYSADYLRVGASGPLKMMAGILGVTFEEFHSPATLDHALRNRLPGLTLIDTPGFSPRDHDAAQSLARVITAHPDVTCHLVLRADTSSDALAKSVDRFSLFPLPRLLFTGLDEVNRAGGIFSVAANSKLPVSFLTNGQTVPEDLESASAARVVELALGAFSLAALDAA